MKRIYTFAFLAFVISIASMTIVAQPPVGRTDESQRRSERRRPEPSGIATPDVYKRPSEMIAAANYTIRCRGGSGYYFREVDGRVSTSGYIITMLEMSFTPSSQPAGSGLQPGQCALIERAFSVDELLMARDPVKIRFETPANSQLKQTQQGSQVDRSPTAAESYPDAITIPVYFQSQNNYWTFHVSDSGQGYFVASSHGVYKSPVAETTMPGKGNRSIFIRN